MILCCGGALIDFVPMTGSKGEAGYLPCPGGSTLNTAIGLARLGETAGFLGRLSTDPFGDRLMGVLRDNEVGADFVVRSDEPTRFGFVVFPEGQSEPRYSFHACITADQNLRMADLPAALPEEVEALHFGSIYMVLEPVATSLETLMVREAGKRLISIDPNVRPSLIDDMTVYRNRFEQWLSRVDVVKASLADIDWLYPGVPVSEVAAHWCGLGPALVVVTKGAEGAAGYVGDTEVDVPGRQMALVDTVGAGDGFQAALLARLRAEGFLLRDRIQEIDGPTLTAALEFACRAAAITCARKGADPPSLQDLESVPDLHPDSVS